MFIIMDNPPPTFEDILFQYNKNHRDYNDNTRIYLEIMLLRERTRNRQMVNARTTEPIFNGATNISSIFPQVRMSPFFINTNMQDVVVAPSYSDIDRATEIIVYHASDSSPHHSCPITLEAFQDGANVCRIKHCRHIFKTTALYNWFRTNVRCPVCRYDIRDYDSDSTPSSPASLNENIFDPSLNNTTRQSPLQTDVFTNTLTSAIRGFVNNELSSMSQNTRDNVSQLLYTFDFPIFDDLSGNPAV